MIAIDHGGGGGQVAFLLNNGEGDKKSCVSCWWKRGDMSRMARGLRLPLNWLLKMLPPLTLITLLMPTTAPAVLKTRCQIWGKIELHYVENLTHHRRPKKSTFLPERIDFFSNSPKNGGRETLNLGFLTLGGAVGQISECNAWNELCGRSVALKLSAHKPATVFSVCARKFAKKWFFG